MLLVDDYHSELVKFDRVLQQGVGTDDDTGLARDHLVTYELLLLRRHRSGQQRHPGGMLGPTELPCHRQWTEHAANR